MKRPSRALIGALVVLGSTVAVAPVAGAQPTFSQLHGQLTWSGTPIPAVVPTAHSGISEAMPYLAKSRQQLASESVTGATVQTWSSSVKANQNGTVYPFTMVGQNVTAGSTTTTVKAFIIPLIVTFQGTGDVYDPTTSSPGCGEPVSAVTGELNSPEFKTRPWYAGQTFVGNEQYPDAQMREQFWSWTNPKGSSPNWHVKLDVTSLPAFSIAASSAYPEVNGGTCAALGEIDMTAWQNFVQTTVLPAYAGDGVGPTTLPIFLVSNVVLTNPIAGGGTSCCVFGYHQAYNNPAFASNTQTYAFSDYQINGDRPGLGQDISGTTHEISEWANDPYGNNPVPSWGHTGQDPTSCQGNLEVGDPLTQNRFVVRPPTPSGMTYHLQELALMGWFFDENFGVNGWYSTRGTFTTGATICS
jgi:hypothetical protein